MKRITCLLLCVLVGIPIFAQLQTGKNVAVANTNSGKVRGFIKNEIYTYKGIPYAQAERFQAPKKINAWEGVRSSMTWGPVAPLVNPTTSVRDESEFVFDHDRGYSNENCLVLNIWTPSLDDSKKRPVLFWIHGGGYTTGSSQELPSYHGENLSRSGDVVVVSVNHRLNILGFLDLSAYGEQFKTSANNGILDLKVALEWVRDNISNFGGDPNNVMIFGQSGGGAKVNNLMAMPAAKGLFHKAVNQSGSFRTGMLKKETTQKVAEEIINELGLSADEITKIKNIPFVDLAAAGQKALKKVETTLRQQGEKIPGFGLNWGPSIDGNVLPFDIFSEEAFELSKDIPLLIGTTKNEFMPSLFSGMTNASEESVMAYIKEKQGDKANAYITAVKEAYPNIRVPSDLIDIDVLFRPGAVYQANKKSALKNGAPVYSYLFAWQSPVMDGKYKAMHCMELPFVFNNIQKAENMTGGGSAAQALADKVSKAWLNFARYGNPNNEGLPNWEPYTEKNGTTMFFDTECYVRNHHDKAFLALKTQN